MQRFPQKTKILVVEDESIVAADIQMRLTSLGYNVAGPAGGAEEAIQISIEEKPDLVLMDINLGVGMDGVEAANQIRRDNDIPVVFLTAHSDDQTLHHAQLSEPFGYVVKPFEEQTLRTTIEVALYRHGTERKIRKLETWFSTTLRSIGDGVIAIDVEGRVTFMNMVAEGLTGWPLAQAFHLPCTEVFQIISERTRQPVENPAVIALSRGLIIQLAPETLLVSRQGKELSIEDSAAPIRDEKGEIIGAVVVFRDVTERHKSELALQRLNQTLESAVTEACNQEKSSKKRIEFLAHAISHDLRSPLTALKLYTQMLGESYKSELGNEGMQVVAEISKSLVRMEEMVSGYLKFGQQDPTKIVKTALVDMDALVNQTIADLSANCGCQKPVFIVTALPQSRGNRTLLLQVWANLLSNAVKYSRNQLEPRVSVQGRIEADKAIYEVTDNGLGFDPDLAGKLFSEYQRLHTDPGIEGVGLGLSVVKHIVERHGGSVWATSQLGAGATFGFSLPLENSP